MGLKLLEKLNVMFRIAILIISLLLLIKFLFILSNINFFSLLKIFGPKGIGAVSIKKTENDRMRIKRFIINQNFIFIYKSNDIWRRIIKRSKKWNITSFCNHFF